MRENTKKELLKFVYFLIKKTNLFQRPVSKGPNGGSKLS